MGMFPWPASMVSPFLQLNDRVWSSQECNYPRDLDGLLVHIGEPDLVHMTKDCLTTQTGTSTEDLPPIGAVAVFHLVVATFFAPSNTSSTCGMWCEHICSTPSWRGGAPCRNCSFIVEDEEKTGISGLNVVWILLFFSVEYKGVWYPCALIEWFQRMGRDPITGMWVVHPDHMCGRQDRTVIRLDCFLCMAHLIPVYGNQKIPLDFDHSYSLDAFEAYYVNRYIDHHSYEILF